jgi:Na+-driven multidrug efflux pump
MKHLQVISIILSIILSVIACILPNWAIRSVSKQKTMLTDGGVDISSNIGLFTTHSLTPFDYQVIPTPAGHGLLPAKIFSITGPILLAISAVLCGMGQHKSCIIATLVGGITCLIATLVIFAASYAPSIAPECKRATWATIGCPVLSTSWYLELGAVILAIIGVMGNNSSPILK